MAKLLSINPTLLSVIVLTLLIALGAVGCQSQSTLVDSVPPPNLSGPEILPAPPAPRIIAARIMPAAPPKLATARPQMGIPRDWIPIASARPWRWIVIHHSATPSGSAAKFDREHKEKGWDELGYHFVIGNGTETGDGQVEVGPRWPIQKHGAHAKTPDNRFNDFGVGICLVGNFDEEHPTAAQLRSTAKLVAFLMQTYHIPPNCVLGHRDTKPTECPGRNVSIEVIRRMAAQVLVDAGELDPATVGTATAQTPDELLTDAPAPQ